MAKKKGKDSPHQKINFKKIIQISIFTRCDEHGMAFNNEQSKNRKKRLYYFVYTLLNWIDSIHINITAR